MPANEFYGAATPFIRLLEDIGYVGTTLRLARHALTALYLFLDMNSLRFRPDVMWAWFTETRKALGSSWRHRRRVLKLYEDYAATGGAVRPVAKYRYHPTLLEELPPWRREAIEGFLDLKRREFKLFHTENIPDTPLIYTVIKGRKGRMSVGNVERIIKKYVEKIRAGASGPSEELLPTYAAKSKL